MLADATNYWFTWFPGALLAFFGVLALLFKGVVWFANATKTLKDTQAALPLIQAEFNNNGGSSMRDRVDALHTRQAEMADLMSKHIDNDKRAFARQDRTNGRVERALGRIESQLKG